MILLDRLFLTVLGLAFFSYEFTPQIAAAASCTRLPPINLTTLGIPGTSVYVAGGVLHGIEFGPSSQNKTRTLELTNDGFCFRDGLGTTCKPIKNTIETFTVGNETLEFKPGDVTKPGSFSKYSISISRPSSSESITFHGVVVNPNKPIQGSIQIVGPKSKIKVHNYDPINIIFDANNEDELQFDKGNGKPIPVDQNCVIRSADKDGTPVVPASELPLAG